MPTQIHFAGTGLGWISLALLNVGAVGGRERRCDARHWREWSRAGLLRSPRGGGAQLADGRSTGAGTGMPGRFGDGLEAIACAARRARHGRRERLMTGTGACD